MLFRTSALVTVLCCASLVAAAPSDAEAAAPPRWEPPVEQFTDLPPTPPEPSTEAPEPGCAPCNPTRCPRTSMECAAGVGLAADPCGCCADGVCGKPEGALCYNASSDADADLGRRALGVCGDNMDCLKRTDLGDADEPEALCVCRDQGQVCGSDNTTYSSSCRMMSARRAGADEAPVKVWLKYRGPCRSAPWIVTPPTPVNYVAGSPVSLECEVKGYPTPAASWERIKDGIAIPLPSDDASLVVMQRGGPEPFMATTWLQIMALREADAGTYICVASNSEGDARAGADVAIATASKSEPRP